MSSSIYPPLNELGPDTVDPGLRVQANGAVRLYPLVRNDLAHEETSRMFSEIRRVNFDEMICPECGGKVSTRLGTDRANARQGCTDL